jgi:hypothetical protein
MPIPDPIDPRLLAAEIAASIQEFNRLAALATRNQVQVICKLRYEAGVDAPDRPILAVQVIAPV